MHDNGVFVGANDARNFVADRHGHIPPAFGPRPHAPRRPNLGVFMQLIESSTRHRTETVRNQVDSSVENREFRPPFEKVIGHYASPLNSLLIYHIHIWSAPAEQSDDGALVGHLCSTVFLARTRPGVYSKNKGQ